MSLDPKKTCSCGRSYDAEHWLSLRLGGYQGTRASDGVWRALELRQCECGSTIAVPVVWTPAQAEVE